MIVPCLCTIIFVAAMAILLIVGGVGGCGGCGCGCGVGGGSGSGGGGGGDSVDEIAPLATDSGILVGVTGVAHIDFGIF